MDGTRFDTLIRTLTTVGSCRSTLRGLLLGSLGPLRLSAAREATAKNCKKITNKMKRKKCLAQAKRAGPCTPTCVAIKPCGSDGCTGSCGSCTGNEVCQNGNCVCVASCAGRSCGSDGCTGSCGSCPVDRTCAGGTCICPSGQELCQSQYACVTACTPGTSFLIPETCHCCTRNGSECDSNPACCSHYCEGTTFKRCEGKPAGDSCEFNEQCKDWHCTNDTCVCPSGSVPCGGNCFTACPGNTFYVPGACRCCIANEGSCSTFPWACCAGEDACTGPNSTCVGRGVGATCQSPAQCASNRCIGGTCGSPPIG